MSSMVSGKAMPGDQTGTRPVWGRQNLQRALSHWVVRDVLAPFVWTRLVLMTVGWIALTLLLPAHNPNAWEASSQSWVKMWSRWDAGWYHSIADSGYVYRPGEQSNAAFYPLFPMLMKAVAVLIGRTDEEGILIAGILVANLALLTGLIYLVALVRLDFDRTIAARTALYLLIFPTSLFLSAVYADPLFLALAVAAFYHARRGQWWIAGLLAAAGTLTRPQGLLVVVALFYEYLAQRQFRLRAIRADILALGLAPAALAGWGYCLYRLFGHPLVGVHASAVWGREMMPPWRLIFGNLAVLYHAWGNYQRVHYYAIIDLSFVAVLFVLVVACWRMVRSSYALFASISFLLMTSSGVAASIMRYGLTLFPIFIVLALVGRRPAFDRAYTVIAVALLSLFMAMFVQWYWVA